MSDQDFRYILGLYKMFMLFRALQMLDVTTLVHQDAIKYSHQDIFKRLTSEYFEATPDNLMIRYIKRRS